MMMAAVLDAEPGNALVRDLLEALKAQEALGTGSIDSVCSDGKRLN